ncbi:MAG: UvrD-helicase domain-containing protein [Dethiobacter sp.]|nr:UvrD-helicase domain-containing protein [Dethiobacter sp.]
MSKSALSDQQVRDAIRSDLDTTFLVEAGAGSGKTASLVARLVALVATGRSRPENMAAVTFTRKAAGELRQRFQDKLEELYCLEASPVVKTRLAEALAGMDQIFLGTIHAFCARLLRERPVEAGLAPSFTEVEGLEEEVLLERAFTSYLTEIRLQRPERLKRLDELDISPLELKAAYRELALYPDVTFSASPAPLPDLSEARGKLYALLERTEPYLPAAEPEKGWDGLQKFCLQALRQRRFLNLDDDRPLLRLLEQLSKGLAIVQKRWPCKDSAKELQDQFNRFQNEVARPLLRQWREHRHLPLLEFLQPAVRSLEALRVRENKLNFQDLLMRAAALLRDKQEVREYFQSRYTHLLVDEFQDTDPLQAEIMLYLTGADVGGQDWTKLVPRPGSLFVVGDPKQSIYRFRRADIDTYDLVQKLILSSGGRVLRLTANFRSLPAIVQFANTAFESLLTAERKPYQASFAPMQDVRFPAPGTAGGVYRLPVEAQNNQEAIAEADAQLVASWIRHCLDTGLSISRAKGSRQPEAATPAVAADFMVLVRYKKQLAIYARALEEYSIPFTISGGGDIAGSAELQEFLYLLQALADPDNPLPLVASLRGPFFGVSDEELYRFRQVGGLFSFQASFPNAAPAILTEALAKIRIYHSWTRTFPVSAALEKVSEDLGLLPLALADSRGRGRAAYVVQALELLCNQKLASLADAVAFLEQLLSDSLEEELDLDGGRVPGVRLMNLHKAKGLEAPVVILANPGKKSDHEPSLHVTRSGEEPYGYLQIQYRKPVKKEQLATKILAQPLCWAAHASEEKRYQQAEELRLLYVAATRAQDILVVSSYPAKPEKSPWHPLESFMAQAAALHWPKNPPPPKTATALTVTPEMLVQARTAIQEALARVAAPTYRCTTVTELSKKQEAPARQYTGRGVAWGNMLHKALEMLVREEESVNLNEMVTSLACGHERGTAVCEEVHEVLREVMATPFWQRVRLATAKHTEIPFGLRVGDTYLTGTVDLAFRERSGWVLADYKTDTIRDEEHLKQLVSYYSPQVREYASRWQEITGEPVRECGLFFIDNLRYVVSDSENA